MEAVCSYHLLAVILIDNSCWGITFVKNFCYRISYKYITAQNWNSAKLLNLTLTVLAKIALKAEHLQKF